MKSINKVMLLSFTATLSLTACDDSDDDDPVAMVNNDASLQGETFVGECSPRILGTIAAGIATGGNVAVRGAQKEYHFTGSKVTHTTSAFVSRDCSGEAVLVFKETGTFKIDQSQKTDDGAKFIDLNWKKLEVVPANSVGLEIANAVELCNNKEWVEDKAVDVTEYSEDMNCFRKRLPAEELNIYLIKESSLYWGDRNFIGPNSARPLVADLDTPYLADDSDDAVSLPFDPNAPSPVPDPRGPTSNR